MINLKNHPKILLTEKRMMKKMMMRAMAVADKESSTLRNIYIRKIFHSHVQLWMKITAAADFKGSNMYNIDLDDVTIVQIQETGSSRVSVQQKCQL